MHRALVLLALLAGMAVVAATPLAAKEGVVAKIRVPVSRSAEPGTRVTMEWELTSVESGKARAFSAEGVFLRLFGRDGTRSRRSYAVEIERGRYRATVRVPRGGVDRVVIGLMGWNDHGPAPVTFPVIGRIFR